MMKNLKFNTMSTKNTKVAIIGGGNIGCAIVKGLLLSGEIPVSNIFLTRRNIDKLDDIKESGIHISTDNFEALKSSEVIIIAVLPSQILALLDSLAPKLDPKKHILVSVVTAFSTQEIRNRTGNEVPVIRVMPNMGAVIGESVTSLSAGSAAGPGDIAAAKEIFSLIGDVVEVEEKLVDAVTAVSGSGPAYFFYMIESLISAARSSGLNAQDAARLVGRTALASAKLLDLLGESPEELRRRVSSKGGTTEAAIKVFEKKRFKKMIAEAVGAARKRSKELSKR